MTKNNMVKKTIDEKTYEIDGVRYVVLPVPPSNGTIRDSKRWRNNQ